MKKLLLLSILPLCSCANHSSIPDMGVASSGSEMVDMSLFPEMTTRTVPATKKQKSGQVKVRKSITFPTVAE